MIACSEKQSQWIESQRIDGINPQRETSQVALRSCIVEGARTVSGWLRTCIADRGYVSVREVPRGLFELSCNRIAPGTYLLEWTEMSDWEESERL